MTTREELVQLLSRPIVFQMPKRLLPPPSWTMHTPYAMWLIDVLKPRTFVELGAFKGTSYCAFCQAVKELKLHTKCFAVDTWAGDPHSNFYGEDVFQDLKAHHDAHYTAFSTLVRKDFDSALPDFEDGSIDLLHIDGFHTYEAVKHDFETWLPKVSDRGVILFHDISVREKDFGVWRFWDEVKARYPHLEVAFGNGLGTLLVGSKIPQEFVSIVSKITSSQDGIKTFQGFFEHLGKPCLQVVEEQLLRDEIERHLSEIRSTSHAWELRGAEIERLQGVEGELRGAVERSQESFFGRFRTRKSGRGSAASYTQALEAKARLQGRIIRLSGLGVSELWTILSVQLPGVLLSKLFCWSWSEGGLSPVRKSVRRIFNSKRLQRNAAKIREAGLFDDEFYEKQLKNGETPVYPLVLHFLVAGARLRLSPHPLFDTSFYVDSKKKLSFVLGNPLVHYLTKGWREERSPHPLFDLPFYQSQIGTTEVEPLQHFMSSRRGRYANPNRLFDPNYYVTHNADAVPEKENPLIHFIKEGADEGLQCHPLFDPGYYFAQYPDVHENGWNPLAHYLLHGWREGRMSAPSVDLTFSPDSSTPEGRKHIGDIRRARVDSANLFVVYGAGHVPFLKNIFLPKLAADSGQRPIHLHLVNFASNVPLMGDAIGQGALTVKDWSDSRENVQIGFGDAHNFLFTKAQPKDCFVIVNPDSVPLTGCLDALFDTYERTSAGIVEARQWPRAHPKEYCLTTGDTPWASGAFSLIDSSVFSEIGGFDPVFFLYGEDVDLSWRVWLSGKRVVHEPKAICGHFTGLYSYRNDRFYHEHFYSTRNFLVLARKFFGVDGEERALTLLETSGFPSEFREKIVQSYRAMSTEIKPAPAAGHPMIKILGMNVYHYPQPITQSLGLEKGAVAEELVAHVG